VNFLHASQLEPEMDYLIDYLIYTKLQLCDWEMIDILAQRFIENTFKKNKPSLPFVSQLISDQPDMQKRSSELYVIDKHQIYKVVGNIKKSTTQDKIRIGYFSADFREHPVSYLTAQLFELHNRDKFEIIAFSFSPETDDNLRKRLKIAFDYFIDVKEKTDLEITNLARQMQIDIAVDLGGFTRGARTNVFAMRAAPIQLSYIGYLGTMGADFYDYLIADLTIIPQDHQQFYSEKIVYLPSYQVNDTKREISEKIFTRLELGLPAEGFVFCCFNTISKITPIIFDCWMRILLAVDGSVLMMLDANQTATNNLIKEARRRGVDPDRLIFVKHLPIPEYLARYRTADLFLDTLPYNAGTTASDALRMGLPILTQMGQSFSSRMAASIIAAVGLPELITQNQEAYEALAIELATSPQKLDDIKTKLLTNLQGSSLYNTKLFTQHLESAYQAIYERYQNNLAPEHIYIG
jgi:predicted O-linked N-acetylglucosamine transferase (SPINDLY family)